MGVSKAKGLGDGGWAGRHAGLQLGKYVYGEERCVTSLKTAAKETSK